ncbi:polynucleotide kinase 3'-phosphatase, putative [Trypanosoma brucei gambiense DAL972]|uniref:Polynucleotide kinase 3'-phosphatase, putative n=1 Tax=Trypanosoma brucei gambiense (strain MHOM/CI/86/DAL972) TaxID=679716 RepID=C9ZQG7_TRYB9|nr:polynucleotide kinase 3'-phosphatase, putative [Trypanosoma brucei gambiense DAL972]CBH11647.1 polynucleotide kinase 3'-phosphatase, putative [Trypanosoma brucei gambiense DAL972]|eukprot:XP_011773932.1 polynucleotide kinase 3'-phosphatase, putative [Trypanosoma brucei gambiense DAL972]
MKRARSPSPKGLSLATIADWKLLHNSVLALLPSAEQLKRSITSLPGENLCLKVAAFDLDDTLIMPKTGAVFPRDDPTDWKWLTPSVPTHLRVLHDGGFMVVIFSNQAGIGGKQWNEKKADVVKQKVVRLSKGLNIPLTAFLSTKDDIWRKPNVGMWTMLQEHASDILKEKVVIGSDTSGYAFYVGDAAGRKITTLAGRKKDFSCSDRKFAYNIGIPFFTPEEFYSCPEDKLLEERKKGSDDTPSVDGKVVSHRLLNVAQASCTVDWGGVGPTELSKLPKSYSGLTIHRILANGTKDIIEVSSPAAFHRASQEMIVFVGYPGCGKTTFFERFFEPHGYAHVNRDKLQTREKCLAEARRWWKAGKSVVIDNTNPSHEDCRVFVEVVKQDGSGRSPLPVRLFLFRISKEMSIHMSNVRARLGVAPKISRVAYNVYQSKFDSWTADSVRSMGIEELVEIPPVASFDGLPKDSKREFFLLS